MIDFLLGAIAVAAAIAGLVFLSYYRRTHDRFFLYFVGAFWLEAFGRVLSVTIATFGDGSTAIYVLRLVSYGLILVAILDKNLPGRGKP
jgi:hypothetical protein